MNKDDLYEQTKESWKTLGTMMFTEQLLISKNAPEQEIQSQRYSIEEYQEVLIKQTNLLAKIE